MPGPPKTPTPILRLRGSHRAKRRPDVNLPPSTPARPDWLDAAEAREWDRVVPQLESLGLLQTVDEWALAQLVCLRVERRAIIEQLRREGMIVERRVVSTGVVKRMPHPLVRILRRVDDALLGMERGFGCTPRSRAALTGSASRE